MNVLNILVHGGLSQPISGGQRRDLQLTQQLKKRGDTILLLEPDRYVDDNDRAIATVYAYRDLSLFGRRLCSFRDFTLSYLRAIWRIITTNDIDLIKLTHPSGTSAARLACVLARKRPSLVYSAHNVESDLIDEAFERDAHYTWIEKTIVPRYFTFLEKLATRIVDGIIVVSDRDRDRFQRKFSVDLHKLYVVPSGRAAVSPLPSVDERKAARQALGIAPTTRVVLFHGFYQYPPNREAFDTIEKQIAPRIAAATDDVLFLLAGTDAPRFERGNVRSIGFVGALDELCAAANIALVPIMRGGGTKIKVFDYMNAALPIVATPRAMEGIDAVDGEHTLIASTVDDLASKLLWLFDNPDECRRIGTSGRQLLETKYTWDILSTRLFDACEHIRGRSNDS
ncbi:MAG: glycosyltransferase family 4 protein [Halobacteriota archaeon]